MKWPKFLVKLFKRKPEAKPLRICARCNQQIKRHERWSAKAWLDDPRPRHWECPTEIEAVVAEQQEERLVVRGEENNGSN